MPFLLRSTLLFSFVAVASAADHECRWAATPPVIDGRLGDAAWTGAQVVEEFTAAWLPEGKRKPPTATKARLLWDREYLYFCAKPGAKAGKRNRREPPINEPIRRRRAAGPLGSRRRQHPWQQFQVLHRFDNALGARSWRKNHPHPIFQCGRQADLLQRERRQVDATLRRGGG